jgi:ABC-type branched-subunit amino acid transport system ATPase component
MASNQKDDCRERKGVYDMFPVLREKQKQKADILSHGYQQIIEFACGLMFDPELLLLDGLTARLAPKIIDDVFAQVQVINARGVTMLMIEQNLKTRLQYADHAFILRNGQTKFDDPTDSTLEQSGMWEIYLSQEV